MKFYLNVHFPTSFRIMKDTKNVFQLQNHVDRDIEARPNIS